MKRQKENELYYICKYTPLELLNAFGAKCIPLDMMPQSFDLADEVAHPNLCGFGKSVVEAVLSGGVKELVLVNCCDAIKSVYDILMDSGRLDFLYMLDMLHFVDSCSREQTAARLKELAAAYSAHSGLNFDRDRFFSSFARKTHLHSPHIAVLGARMGKDLFKMAQDIMPLPLVNETCVHNRDVGATRPPEDADFDASMDWYAGELLGQLPCMRMIDKSKRRELYEDPYLVGIIYHTIKFCDFYNFEYAEIKNHAAVPLLKIESDYTLQSKGQLLTRLEAFAEELAPKAALSLAASPPGALSKSQDPGLEPQKSGPEEDEGHSTYGMVEKENHMWKGYYAGIDSGSASTDVVILNEDREIVAGVVLPTGAGANMGAQRALEKALEKAGLKQKDIKKVVATGYGRSSINTGDKTITEISCHARGAYFLDKSVRTVIDIGGQDSKIIRLNDDGSVSNFVMNDKCAAGTGRFLEMMARTMEMSLDEISNCGINYREDITISSVCTVFAESEVVSLIAQNKQTDDIVHGLNKAVTARTVSLIKRVGGKERYMMTGGVAQNKGLVKTLENKLHTELIISDKAQLCGALGAALFAMELA